MKRSAFLSVIFLITVLFFALNLKAQVPQLINYQGVLTDPTTGNPVADKIYAITFAIYSVETQGTPLWTETQNVVVTGGYFNVSLGSVDPNNNPLPYSLFDGSDRYLGVKVGTDTEMTPRKRIVSVGYAMKSYNTDKVDGKDASAFALVSHDHNTLYFTKSELSTSDGNPPNSGSNRVSWNNLKDVPAGFADGADDVGTADGISQVNVGTGMTVVNATGPTTTLGLKMGHGNGINADQLDGKHGSSFANAGHTHSGSDITSGKISNTRLNTGSGHGLDADKVDGKHASAFAEASHDHWGENWSGSGYGLQLTSSNNHSLYIPDAGKAGVYVAHAKTHGIHIDDAGANGVDVAHANGDGVKVYSAGNDGIRVDDANLSGVYVAHANLSGVEVHSAGNDGVRVDDANWSGVYVAHAAGDALRVQTAGQDGLRIYEGVGRDYIRAGSDADMDFRVTKNGTAYADGGWQGPADFAELIEKEGSAVSLEPGDVLIISHDKDRAVALSSQPYSTAVIGIYSTKPGFVGSTHPMEEKYQTEVPVAITGIVPCKVSTENGSIQRGDLLTTSSTPGYAMKASNPKIGTILGKAMASLESGKGKIEVLVMQQ